MYDYKHFTVAVDFDDTCVVAGAEYPDVVANVPYAVDTLRKLARMEIRIVLWTCRTGAELDAAVNWFNESGIPLYGVCENPDPYWVENPTRKIYADVYIDDKGVGTPMIFKYQKWVVDWKAIYQRVLYLWRIWNGA